MSRNSRLIQGISQFSNFFQGGPTVFSSLIIMTRETENSTCLLFRDNRRKRRRLEKKWRKNKNEEDRKEYIEQRKVCAELSASKQNEYYTKLVDDAGNDQKSLFKVANHLLDKGKTRVLPEHTDPLQLANRFNKYYIDKIDKLRKSIPPSNIESQVGRKKFEGVELSVFEPATDEELTKIIKSFGIKTSPEDPIPADVLQSVIDVAYHA